MHLLSKLKFACLALCCLLASTKMVTAQIYVDASATAPGDGLSWNTAFTDLQSALTAANLGDDIYVAEGTYYPATAVDRNASFEIPNGVDVFGGFPTGGGSFNQRNWELYPTILSGDLLDDSNISNNSLHVVRTTDITMTTIIDGVIIEEGNADLGGDGGNGGGWFNEVTGGATSSNPTIRNTVFRNNIANNGGGLYTKGNNNTDGSIHFINCIFDSNTATSSGGVLYANASVSGMIVDLEFVNCLFIQNTANGTGNVIYNNATVNGTINADYLNVVFYDNGPAGQLIYNDAFNNGLITNNIVNSIFYDNSGDIFTESDPNNTVNNISYSIQDNATWGLTLDSDINNLINTDPLFISPATGNFKVLSNSPTIDAGDPATTLTSFYQFQGDYVDLDLKERLLDNRIDIGIIEYVSTKLLNCKEIVPGITFDGLIEVKVSDIAAGANSKPEHDILVKNGWGGVIWSGYGLTKDDLILPDFDICPYFAKTLTVEINNGVGTCIGKMRINNTPPVLLTTRFEEGQTGAQYGLPTAQVSNGKLVTYCGYVPSPSRHTPIVTVPCENSLGDGAYGLTTQPDWIMPRLCDLTNDTAEIIYRTWEVFNKDDEITTLTDTIIVLRLPAFAPESFIGFQEDTVYCEIENNIAEGQALKHYEAWGQHLGLHDYEVPNVKLQGVLYELPSATIQASYNNAKANDPTVLEKYLNCVILKKANGDSYTIKDILNGSYYNDLIAGLSPSQTLYQHRIDDYSPVSIPSTSYNYRPIILLERGDEILSENGYYLEVTSDWFYNGHGKTPFWFAGAWPWIYGNGDCVSYCDVASDGLNGCDVVVIVPALEETPGNPELGIPENCIILCLEELAGKAHCNITISKEEHYWTNNCPATKGKDIVVKQSCWANGPNAPEPCEWDFYEEAAAADNLAVNEELSDFDGSKGTITVVISQWLSLIDTIGPIFDFCYPLSSTIGNSILPCHINQCEDLIWEHDQRWISVTEDFQIFAQPIGTIFSQEEYDNADSDVQALFVPYVSVIEEHIRAGTQYESARRWEECNPTVYSSSSHDCAANVLAPSITVKDNCAGVHSMKVKVGKRSIEMTKVAEDEDGNVTFAHLSDPFIVPFNGPGFLTEVLYEAADSCWNQSTWTKYITVKDQVKPIVSTDDNVRVSLNAKEVWVDAESFNEGSWDNCGIDLVLARRADWYTDTACLDVCNAEKYTKWLDLLEDLGFNRSEMQAVIGGTYLCGDYSYDITKLRNFLNEESVESHYFEKLVWLWEDSYACGELVIHGWIYDIVRLILEGNCGYTPNLKIKDFEIFLDRIVGRSNYGEEVALLGGGWSTGVPFKCTDVCENPIVEVLVVDYWCNWNTGYAEVEVEDKSQAIEQVPLEDVWLSCESYNKNYKDLFEAAAAYGEAGSSADGASATFEAIDQIFGYYVEAWKNKNQQVVDANGQLINPEDYKFTYTNIECDEKETITKVADTLHNGFVDWINVIETETILEETSVEGQLGIMTVLCSMRNVHQDVWIDIDDCGIGKITRRFSMQGGCDPKSPVYIFEQVIYIEATCPVRLSMFDLPDDIDSKIDPLCVPSLEEAEEYLPIDVTGEVVLKPALNGAICNSMAIAVKKSYILEILNTQADAAQLYKLVRIWNIKDWCTKDQIDYEQFIIFKVDPSCAVSPPNEDEVNINGKIQTLKGENIEQVEVEATIAQTNSKKIMTADDGQFSFMVPMKESVVLTPQKNNNYSNGISTLDVIALQSHVLQKNLIEDPYSLIAADVNNDNQINAFDVLETRKMVLNPGSKFANNSSWRFFVNDGTMREQFTMGQVDSDYSVDFIGVKIGDVNQTSDPSRNARSQLSSLHLQLEDMILESGQTYRLPITSDNFIDIAGMQFTLTYDDEAIDIVEIEGGALNITKDHYALYQPGYITASWSEGSGLNIGSGQALYTLVVKAKSNIQLSDIISLTDKVINAEAYDGHRGLKNLDMQFVQPKRGFKLYQNSPNPFQSETSIEFELPAEDDIQLSIYDITGKVIKIVKGHYKAGHHQITINQNELNVHGVLYYQLETNTLSATKKMIVIE